MFGCLVLSPSLLYFISTGRPVDDPCLRLQRRSPLPGPGAAALLGTVLPNWGAEGVGLEPVSFPPMAA